MSTASKFDNKRILIWGYGREGKSTEGFLKKHTNPQSVDIFEGPREGFNEDDYDYIFKSPGIVYDGNEKYTSQTQVFLDEYREQAIGITGTKGKSTTSALLNHILSNTGDKKSVLLGNIGIPCLDFFGEIDKDTKIVFELSCHQLAHVTTSPRVAVLLNLYEEHLDYYKSVDEYFGAKKNIAKFQTGDDYLVLGKEIADLVPGLAKRILVDEHEGDNYDICLYGKHNQFNARVAVCIASEIFGVDKNEAGKVLSSFKPLSHRLEYVGDKDGISFYDDSISTIPEACISAAMSLPNLKTIIIGGMDRGINYDILISFIKEHEEFNYILAYDSGKRIYESVGSKKQCRYVDDLEKAVALAKEITPSRMGCLMSPAAASYGYFKNFEERGDKFKEYVFK